MIYPHYYKNIQGWFNSGFRRMYEYQVKNCKDNAHFVEVGAWKGKALVIWVLKYLIVKRQLSLML